MSRNKRQAQSNMIDGEAVACGEDNSHRTPIPTLMTSP